MERTETGTEDAEDTATRETVTEPDTDVSRLLVERYEGRRRSRERWTRLAVSSTCFLLLLALIGYLVLWHTGVFDVRSVSVTGTKVVTQAEVERAAAVQKGSPLAAVDAGAIRARVETIPRVASVRVYRQWPHGLRIDVTERQIAAAVPVPGGYSEMDAGGFVFATTRTPPKGVPIIALSGPAAANGSTRAAAVRSALTALRALPPQLASTVRQLKATSGYGVSLVLAGGVTVTWGGGDTPQSAARKAQLLGVLMRQHARHYDVSVPDAPALSS